MFDKLRKLYIDTSRPLVIGFSIAASLFIGIFASVLYDFGKSYFDGAFKPYVAVVLARKQVDFGVPAEFQKGFDKKFNGKGAYFETKDGRKVDIKLFEDFGSIEEAKRIAKELANDEECILVIGNSNSTVTSVTLSIFLESENPPSYILPIATATNIIEKASVEKYEAILQLLPDNSSQAKQIQRLVENLVPKPRVAIFGDQENPLYSEELMRDVASRIRSKGGSVIIEEKIGPLNSIFNLLYIWKLTDTYPDLIVYLGVGHHALLLIDQMREMKNEVPVIFSDGSMVEAVIENISRIPNKAFILSPVRVSKKSEPKKFPTYEPIGEDTFTLTSRLINSCENCNKKNMRLAVQKSKNKSLLPSGEAGEYKFNADGKNVGMDYKVYEITNGHISSYDAL